jgi:hypothetical protein
VELGDAQYFYFMISGWGCLGRGNGGKLENNKKATCEQNGYGAIMKNTRTLGKQ